MPLHHRNGLFRSSASGSDRLRIWRLDPDANHGAKDGLNGAVQTYHQVQQALGYIPGSDSGDLLWGLDVEADRVFSPLQRFPPAQNSLGRVLNSAGHPEVDKLLDLFYTQADRNQDVSRGFYQKPFVGSALVANLPGDFLSAIDGSRFEGGGTRFFVCGSLFGGTGASGVPVVAEILSEDIRRRKNPNWKVGGCILGPYFTPPKPNLVFPGGQPRSLDELNQQGNPDAVKHYIDEVHAANRGQYSREEVEQILQGYYAKPEELTRRSANSLVFYQDHADRMFDRLYYLGGRDLTSFERERWSNGGSRQQNPSHAMEYAAATAALDFFSRSPERLAPDAGGPQPLFQIPASSVRGNASAGLDLADLCRFGDPGNEVHAGRWVAATSAVLQCLEHHFAFRTHYTLKQLKGSGFRALEKSFADENGYQDFVNRVLAVQNCLTPILSGLFTEYSAGVPPERRTLGWGQGIPERVLSAGFSPRDLPQQGHPVFSFGEPGKLDFRISLETLRELGQGRALQPAGAWSFLSLLWKSLYLAK